MQKRMIIGAPDFRFRANKRYFVVCLTAIFAILLGHFILATGSNTVLNPSFETGDFTNWFKIGTSSAIFVNASNAYDGTYKAGFQDPTTSYSGRGILSNNISVISNTSYTLSGWFRVVNEAGIVDASNIRLYVQWYDVSGALISTSGFTTLQRLSAFDTWQLLITNVLSPSNAVNASVIIDVQETTNNNNDIWADFIGFARAFPPSIRITSPINQMYNFSNLSLNYAVSDLYLQSCWYSTDSGITNYSLICGNNVTGLNVSQGNNVWTVYANDSAGNLNFSRVTFGFDNITPQVYYGVGTDANNSHINRKSILVNVSVNDTNLQTVVVALYNSTFARINSTISNQSLFANFSVLEDGIYYFDSIVNDSAGNSNNTETYKVVIDTSAPSFSNFGSTSNASAYISGRTYVFNVTITEIQLDTVGIEFNGKNYTLSNLSDFYSFNISDLGAGTYPYYWWANDSFGIYNHSNIFYYTVSKAVNSVVLLLNGTSANITFAYGNTLNASASSLAGIVSLYRDELDVSSQNGLLVTPGVSLYKYTANATGNQNYSSANVGISFYLNVTKAFPMSSMAVSIFPSNSVTYGTSISAQGAESNFGDGDLTYYLYRNNLLVGNPDPQSLGAGFYTYIYNTTGGQNYTSGSVNSTLNVSKANNFVNLLLNGYSSNLSISYPQQVNASVYSTLGLYGLFRNSVDVSSTSGLNVSLSAGNYTYYANSTGNQNYSANNTGMSFSVFVNQGVSQVSLYINHSRGDFSVYRGTVLPINASLDVGQGTIQVFVNHSLIYSGTSPSFNLTNFTLNGLINVTAIYFGSQNYTSGFETWFVNVSEPPDVIAPIVNIALPAEGSVFGTNTSLSLNYSVQDSYLQSCWYSLDGQTNISLPLCANITFGVAAGTHQVYVYANDTSGNLGHDSHSFNIVLGAPSISPLSPLNGTYSSSNIIVFNYTAIDVDLESCELWGNFTGTFAKNKTYLGAVSGMNNNFTLRLSDGTYSWAIVCNDSFNNRASTANYSLFVDTNLPVISLSSPKGTYNSLTGIPLQFSVSDASPTSCTYNYSLVGLSGSGNINLANCSLTTSFSVGTFGNYQFYLTVNDSAGNINYSSNNFLVSQGSGNDGGGSSSGGGGGGSSSGSSFYSRLNITSPSNSYIKRGQGDKIILSVKNTGLRFLNSCTLSFTGDLSKYLSNRETVSLGAGEIHNFQTDIFLPNFIGSGQYKVGVGANCNESSFNSSFYVVVIPTEFDYRFVRYERSVDELTVFYTLEEQAKKDQEVTIDYSLKDSSGIEVTTGTENVTIISLSHQDRSFVLKLPKDSVGEYTLYTKISNSGDALNLENPVFLSAEGVTGLAISDNNLRTLRIFGIYLAAGLILVFVVRFIVKYHNNTREHPHIHRIKLHRFK